MKRIVRLNESDIRRIVNEVLDELETRPKTQREFDTAPDRLMDRALENQKEYRDFETKLDRRAKSSLYRKLTKEPKLPKSRYYSSHGPLSKANRLFRANPENEGFATLFNPADQEPGYFYRNGSDYCEYAGDKIRFRKGNEEWSEDYDPKKDYGEHTAGLRVGHKMRRYSDNDKKWFKQNYNEV